MKYSYDEIPYKSKPFPQSHPDRLATIARLFGIEPTPIDRCRVLELGCASGGNLIPMAFHLPESEFVGVDLSGRQIQQASETITSLDLNNIRVENTSIMDIDETWGKFDYIICHGVYAWVPDEVQEKILAVSSANLTSNGVAYVSYNTYPGWHLREMVRNMMQYHIGQIEDTDQRIEQARALIDFLAGSVSEDSYYGKMLKSELDLVKRVKNWYLFHDHLEEINKPQYFHQFVERAAKHNLQYLGEADFSTMLSSGFPNHVAETLSRISPNIIRKEQYMDFLRNRFFRQTLLCHNGFTLNRNLDAHSLEGLLIASSAAPETDPVDLSPGIKQSFRTPLGEPFNTDFPLTKAALWVLSKHWPKAINLERLRIESRQQLGIMDEKDISMNQKWNTTCGDLLHCYTLNNIDLHAWQANFKTVVSKKPGVSKMVLHQVLQGNDVVNQRHEKVSLDAVGRAVVRGLDGDKDHKALLEYLVKCVKTGELVIRKDERPVTEQTMIQKALDKVLHQTLHRLAKVAILVK